MKEEQQKKQKLEIQQIEEERMVREEKANLEMMQTRLKRNFPPDVYREMMHKFQVAAEVKDYSQTITSQDYIPRKHSDYSDY